jgi:phosphate transport system substrate-binding protein
MKIKYLIFIVSAIGFFGCQSDSKKESPTSGRMELMVSETVLPVANHMADRFEELYPDSRIDVVPTSASEAVACLLNDSVEAVIISRPLNKDEEAFITKNELRIGKQEVAVGGFVVIVNKNNPVISLRVSQLDSIFKGYTFRWKNLGWKNTVNPLHLFITNPNTDIFSFVDEQFLHGNKLPKYSTFVPSMDSIINAVSLEPAGIGIVGLNYYDAMSNQVRFLELSDKSKLSDSLGVSGQSFSPAQAYVYRKHYPLRASVYIYSNIVSVGLASGFVSFATSLQGQKIIQNNKLVPATMPVRIIQLNKEK